MRVQYRQALPEGRGRRVGLAWSQLVSLVAVGSVVVLVSLPRLRSFAMHENESDAVVLVHTLARAAADRPTPPAALGELEFGEGQLKSAFRDRSWIVEGRVLSMHGYLFDLVPGAEGVAVCAWPSVHGRTGRRAFVLRPDGVLLGHGNGGAGWTGQTAPPDAPWSEVAGWAELSVPRRDAF